MSDASVEDVGEGVRWRERKIKENKQKKGWGPDVYPTVSLALKKQPHKFSLPPRVMGRDIHEHQH